MMLTPEAVCGYLAHLGIAEAPAATENFLVALTRAHLEVVPFENLDVHYAHKEPSLAAADLYNKVVGNKRGGYCFELNKLFFLLLTELGFDCRSVAARVINNRPEPCPISHRAVVVTVEGKRYFCDVGFGGAGPKGILPLDDGTEQTVAGQPFHISCEEDGIAISTYENGELWRVLKFKDEPWLDVDFATLNRYYATYHHSPFLLKRILYITTEDGWKSLIHQTFTRMSGDTKIVTELEPDQVKAVIAAEFNLAVPEKK